ncbi:hypothetical protein MSSIT_0419 [Methanosarcina siciliae T4/M]|uniref:SLC26A/SulP transporter domain-containing protein n=1 Tax=Methanosarcina siciliae T4/M TaxID=1434120 RepID=A0A0E3P1C0_9EURY|nr:hypothetical protein MSSIT_0419 [Methanosarcina siciliae T4/M]
MTRFISNAVMTGFFSGIAITIILSQLGGLTGFESEASSHLTRPIDLLFHLGQIHWPSLLTGLATMAIIFLLACTRLKNYALIIALLGVSAVVSLVGLESVQLVGDRYNIAATTVDGDVQNAKRKWLAWQPVRIDFWVTFSQFLGTIMFNFNTFDAFLNLGWIGQDLLIWVPDMVGSIFFQISGTLAVFEICHRWWCWRSRNIDWWITIINFVGCVAFLISAFLAYIRPDPIFDNLALWSTAFTLIGAVCFFVGAYLMWPEMAREESA